MTEKNRPHNRRGTRQSPRWRADLSRVARAARDLAGDTWRWIREFVEAGRKRSTLPAITDIDDEATTPLSTRSILRFGAGVISVAFGGLAIWSVAAPIDGAVLAGGQVVVEGNRKTIQHLDGGVIEEIHVREGQQVRQEQVVVRLQSTEQRANLALIDGQLVEFYARRARLIAERDGLDHPATPTGDPIVLGLPAFREKQDGQMQLFAARQATRLTQISLLEERITQQSERMAGLDAQINSLRNQTRLIEEELAGVRRLFEKGYAPKNRVRALERERERLRGERGARQASVSEGKSVISEARLEIERVNSGARQEAITELRDVEVKVAELEERRLGAGEALTRTKVLAPQDGWVLGLSVHTVGGVIAPGARLMDIVPGGDQLQIAVQVTPRHIDKVHLGQETLVRFSALGTRNTPEVVGRVMSISADSIIDESTNTAYYLAMIDLPEGDDLNLQLQGNEILPGMPVEAYIRTGKRSAISYFLKPLTDAFARSMREQ